jgi:hypothetical protein
MRVTRNDAACRARSIRQWSRNDLCVERPSEIVRVDESSLLPRGSVTNVGDAMRAAGLAVATLIRVVNPLGSAPIFLSMSADLPPVVRRQLPRQVAWNSFLLLAAAMLVGSHILQWFGISVPIVRVLRLTAFILLCVGVGMMWGGLSELLRALITPR